MPAPAATIPAATIKPGIQTTEFWAHVAAPWLFATLAHLNVLQVADNRVKFATYAIAVLCSANWARLRTAAKAAATAAAAAALTAAEKALSVGSTDGTHS